MLTACADGEPGAAAVVDGERIELSDVDATARGYCELTVLQGQAPDKATLRRQALADHVALDVALDLVEQRGLQVPRSEWIVPVADREGLAAALPDADVEAVIEAAELNGRLAVTVEVLGAPAGSPEVAREQGREAVAGALATREVQVDPRLGLDDALEPTGANGSLSVPSGETEPVDTTGCA